jgi:hypothetical protein
MHGCLSKEQFIHDLSTAPQYVRYASMRPTRAMEISLGYESKKLAHNFNVRRKCDVRNDRLVGLLAY